MGEGVRSWPRECSECSRIVHRTNFMMRWGVIPDGSVVRIDTHDASHMEVGWDEIEYVRLLSDAERAKMYFPQHQSQAVGP